MWQSSRFLFIRSFLHFAILDDYVIFSFRPFAISHSFASFIQLPKFAALTVYAGTPPCGTRRFSLTPWLFSRLQKFTAFLYRWYTLIWTHAIPSLASFLQTSLKVCLSFTRSFAVLHKLLAFTVYACTHPMYVCKRSIAFSIFYFSPL
jgi:hypothetical protein